MMRDWVIDEVLHGSSCEKKHLQVVVRVRARIVGTNLRHSVDG